MGEKPAVLTQKRKQSGVGGTSKKVTMEELFRLPRKTGGRLRPKACRPELGGGANLPKAAS